MTTAVPLPVSGAAPRRAASASPAISRTASRIPSTTKGRISGRSSEMSDERWDAYGWMPGTIDLLGSKGIRAYRGEDLGHTSLIVDGRDGVHRVTMIVDFNGFFIGGRDITVAHVPGVTWELIKDGAHDEELPCLIIGWFAAHGTTP